MKQSVNFNDFVDAFHAFDRYDQFGYSALRVIFDHIEQYEDETGEEIELDVVSICCDICVDTWEDIAKNYSIDLEGIDVYNDEASAIETVEDYLHYRTCVLGTTDDGQIVYNCF